MRNVDERSGDNRPHLIGCYTGVLGLVSMKIILLYRPEIHGFLCEENGQTSENIDEVNLLRNRHYYKEKRRWILVLII